MVLKNSYREIILFSVTEKCEISFKGVITENRLISKYDIVPIS